MYPDLGGLFSTSNNPVKKILNRCVQLLRFQLIPNGVKMENKSGYHSFLPEMVPILEALRPWSVTD